MNLLLDLLFLLHGFLVRNNRLLGDDFSGLLNRGFLNSGDNGFSGSIDLHLDGLGSFDSGGLNWSFLGRDFLLLLGNLGLFSDFLGGGNSDGLLVADGGLESIYNGGGNNGLGRDNVGDGGSGSGDHFDHSRFLGDEGSRGQGFGDDGLFDLGNLNGRGGNLNRSDSGNLDGGYDFGSDSCRDDGSDLDHGSDWFRSISGSSGDLNGRGLGILGGDESRVGGYGGNSRSSGGGGSSHDVTVESGGVLDGLDGVLFTSRGSSAPVLAVLSITEVHGTSVPAVNTSTDLVYGPAVIVWSSIVVWSGTVLGGGQHNGAQSGDDENLHLQ